MQYSTASVVQCSFLGGQHNFITGVSHWEWCCLHHRHLDCLLNPLSRRASKKPRKLRISDLYEGNSRVAGDFPAQRASNAENVSICWRHHVTAFLLDLITDDLWYQNVSRHYLLTTCLGKPNVFGRGLLLCSSCSNCPVIAQQQHWFISHTQQPHSDIEINTQPTIWSGHKSWMMCVCFARHTGFMTRSTPSTMCQINDYSQAMCVWFEEQHKPL